MGAGDTYPTTRIEGEGVVPVNTTHKDMVAFQKVVEAMSLLPKEAQARILQSAVLFFGLADDLPSG